MKARQKQLVVLIGIAVAVLLLPITWTDTVLVNASVQPKAVLAYQAWISTVKTLQFDLTVNETVIAQFSLAGMNYTDAAHLIQGNVEISGYPEITNPPQPYMFHESPNFWLEVGNLWQTVGDVRQDGAAQILLLNRGTYHVEATAEFAWIETLYSCGGLLHQCVDMGWDTHHVSGSALLQVSLYSMSMLKHTTITYHNWSLWSVEMAPTPDNIILDRITGFSNSCGKDCWSSQWILPAWTTGTVSWYSL